MHVTVLLRTLAVVFTFQAALIYCQEESDACQDAVSVSVDDNSPIASTTIGASSGGGFDISFNQCGGETFDVGTPGVWFTVEGTGATFKASTCSETGGVSHRITIYSGADCDSTICRNSSTVEDPDCPYPYSSNAQWMTNPGERYFILVHDQDTTESGDFELTVADVSEPPVNDACETAEILMELETTTGSTIGSAPTAVLMECENNPTSAATPGVWYKIPASAADKGETISVFMCSDSIDLELAVFAGNPCGEAVDFTCQETGAAMGHNFQCATNDNVPVAISAAWNSTSQIEYYVLVYGTSSAVFGVTFTRTSSDNDGNDDNGTTNDTVSGAGETRIWKGGLYWLVSLVFLATAI